MIDKDEDHYHNMLDENCNVMDRGYNFHINTLLSCCISMLAIEGSTREVGGGTHERGGCQEALYQSGNFMSNMWGSLTRGGFCLLAMPS
jgi:hypothetical protein